MLPEFAQLFPGAACFDSLLCASLSRINGILSMNKESILKQKVVSPVETAQVAAAFANNLQPGDVLAFYGDLGSGKTFFTKAVCRELQTAEEPTSPTFTIVNEYFAASGMPVYHFDFYRIEHDAELSNLGLDDYFYGDGICLIEWANKISAHLPIPRYDIYINPVEGKPESRTIRIEKILP